MKNIWQLIGFIAVMLSFLAVSIYSIDALIDSQPTGQQFEIEYYTVEDNESAFNTATISINTPGKCEVGAQNNQYGTILFVCDGEVIGVAFHSDSHEARLDSHSVMFQVDCDTIISVEKR